MIKYLLAVVIGLWTHAASAQNSLRLQQCIDSALKNSLQLKADQLDMEKTKVSIKQARNNLILPTATASGSYQYQFKVPVQLVPAELFGGQPGKYQVAQFSVPQSKSVSIDVSQQIFNASAFIALKAAKAVITQNELQILSSKEDLVYNVSACYYNIQVILRQIQLLEKNLSNTEALLQSTSDQLNAGLATETDVDRLTVSRDNSKASLESSHNNMEKAYNLLKLLMNVSMDALVSVATEDNLDVTNMPVIDFNLNQKTNYRQLLESKRIADLERRNIKAGYLPTLTLSNSMGYSGYYSNANPFKNLNDRWYSSSSISLKLSVPVFDGFSKKNQIRQKQIEMDKYDVQAEQIKQQNLKDVADAYQDYKSNLNTLATQQRNLGLAQKVLDDVNIQYKSGIVKVTDVINSQTELHTAQNNYITALINIKQADLNLKKAQGTLINP